MSRATFRGCASAIVTPFRADLSLDEDALRRVIRRQIDGGMDFVVPCGTTGESPTLTHAEHLRVCEIAVEECRGKVPVLAGCGGYDTAAICALAKELEALGVDGLLSVTPYYNRPTQEGLYRHYVAIAESTKLPIVLYSVQKRTGVNIEPATVLRLAQVSNIVAIKEASGDIGQIATILNQVPDDFLVLSGDDAITLPLLALGGHGLISVAGNEAPGPIAEMVHLALAGDWESARSLHRRWFDLMNVNFVESSPGPVKAALGMMGVCEPVARLPIVMPRPETEARIREVLTQVGLI